MAEIAERVRANTRAVLEAAQGQGILPRQAALELAASRVRQAMQTRRFGGL
jgi:glutamate dehydrogenase (NAD(P)+)